MESIGLKVSKEQKAAWGVAAKRDGKALSKWMRWVLDAACVEKTEAAPEAEEAGGVEEALEAPPVETKSEPIQPLRPGLMCPRCAVNVLTGGSAEPGCAECASLAAT